MKTSTKVIMVLAIAALAVGGYMFYTKSKKEKTTPKTK